MAYQVAQTAKGPMEYRLEGTGPVVLVLQGGHCSRATRLPHGQLAAAGFTILVPSRPGYDSTPASVGRTAQEAADALGALLDTLGIETVSVIGISAAGPTALAFAQRHPDRVRSLILESAVTLPWNPVLKLFSRLLFGRLEKYTWSFIRFGLRVAPLVVIKAMMWQFSTLPVRQVLQRMNQIDLESIRHMLYTMRSREGFLLDIEHRVDELDGIQGPVLVIYSPHDKTVPPEHAQRIAREVPHAQLYEVPAESHLIWLGSAADQVWHKRLEFLQSTG